MDANRISPQPETATNTANRKKRLPRGADDDYSDLTRNPSASLQPHASRRRTHSPAAATASVDDNEDVMTGPPVELVPRPVAGASRFPPLLNDLVLRAARGEKVERAPVWIMRQAGRYLPEFRKSREKNDFFTICRTPRLACEVTLQPIDRYGPLLDASIIFSDILVVPQAMGLEVQMLEKVGPHFPDPLRVPADLARLRTTVDVEESLGYVLDAISLTRVELRGRVPLFGFVGAPWTLMAYMIEGGSSKTLSKAKTWLFRYPEESKRLLQSVTNVCIDFLVAQARAGAQLLQVFDSWGGELSPHDFAQFSLPYLEQIATVVSDRLTKLGLNVPLVVFARGAHYALDDLSRLKYSVVSIDWTMDPEVARKIAGGRVTLQGNADPSLLYADPKVIKEVARTMLTKFGPERLYIANLGHGMYPDHDPEHLRAYLEAIRDVSTELCAKAK
ncbi:Uroporphyrinogen decarboxylase in heme biosynthesis [Cladochytrium tenue]|nr:Uroporphyrinogen decarboxylase in heme biosynthesis [Cladochytrium tenue]